MTQACIMFITHQPAHIRCSALSNLCPWALGTKQTWKTARHAPASTICPKFSFLFNGRPALLAVLRPAVTKASQSGSHRYLPLHCSPGVRPHGQACSQIRRTNHDAQAQSWESHAVLALQQVILSPISEWLGALIWKPSVCKRAFLIPHNNMKRAMGLLQC